MRRLRLLAVTCAVVPLLAIAPTDLRAQDTAAAAAPAAKKPPKGRANLITEEEIAAGGTFQNAMEVVQRLRPAMLRVRSGSMSSGSGMSSMDVGSNELSVYLDNQRLGGADALKEIMLSQFREIRYLSANDATTLFGTGHQAGAIQVVGRR
ncbi:MAG: hypothetical protein IT355_05685 [Gemmatimonadaceae bacterium]|nr:hypothetical protein [Gemmatimonadaceae bacterium]